MSALLQPADLRALDSFEFAPRTVVEGYLSGRHRSRVAGSSTEFRDYRSYTPGDDLRGIDWRVFARSDRYYLRTHNQETNTRAHILVDSSASMGFGGAVSKLRYASFFAAAAAYLVVRGGDAVSLTLFDDEVRRHFPANATAGHLQHLFHALESNQAGRTTSIAESLRKTSHLLSGKGTLLVLSDFYEEPAEVLAALGLFTHRGFDVHLFHVLDPAERDLPDAGLVSFEDMETRQRLVAHTRAISAAYGRAVAGHADALRAAARDRGIEYTSAPTDGAWARLFDRLVA